MTNISEEKAAILAQSSLMNIFVTSLIKELYYVCNVYG
jgi:hypothetical protein